MRRPHSPAARSSRSKLTFVIIGGRATEVETASELHELIHDVIASDEPNIDPHRVRIILVNSNEQVLKELDPALRRTAREKLADLEIEVICNVKAKEITANKVILDDGRGIETENAIWTAGARASEMLDDFDLPQDDRKGLKVDVYVRVEDHDVWGVGDCAANFDKDDPVPPNAQAATQEGRAVAKNMLAVIDGGTRGPFDYGPLGQLVESVSEFAVTRFWG